MKAKYTLQFPKAGNLVRLRNPRSYVKQFLTTQDGNICANQAASRFFLGFASVLWLPYSYTEAQAQEARDAFVCKLTEHWTLKGDTTSLAQLTPDAVKVRFNKNIATDGGNYIVTDLLFSAEDLDFIYRFSCGRFVEIAAVFLHENEKVFTKLYSQSGVLSQTTAGREISLGRIRKEFWRYYHLVMD